jgi:hypothetical protein
MMTNALDDSVQPRKSWWGRNWFWVVPLGCLMPLLLVGGCVLIVLISVTNLTKSIDAYTQSLSAPIRACRSRLALRSSRHSS